jgi:hypothetical protein
MSQEIISGYISKGNEASVLRDNCTSMSIATLFKI